MKVRVEQIGELYYPQYRRMCLWRMCLWRNFKTDSPGHTYDIDVKFGTLEEAIRYAKKFDKTIHEIN